MRSNQGFASVKTTFPMGSFATCRFPDDPTLQRSEGENTWHPQYPGVTEVPAAMPNPPYNTTGTKPLPIPHNLRPGYDEELAKEAAEKKAKYEAFKALRLSNVGGDKIPDDYHDHTIFSAEHASTEHHAGSIYRPSKPRVGTTPHERAAAAAKLANDQAAAEATGRVQAAEARAEYIRQAQEALYDEQWRQAAVDPARPQRTAGQQPTHYNIPTKQTQYTQARY